MIKKRILIFAGIYLMLLLGFYLFQEKIIFRSKKLDKNFNFNFAKKFQEYQIETADHGLINGIHFSLDSPKGILLYFHGNKGNLERWGDLVSPFTEVGYEVFVIDYRGYGKSTGKRSESAMYNDAQEVYTFLTTELNYAEKDISLYGRSLGCTFATYVAAKNNPKQLILEAPFNSLIEVVHRKFPLLPYKLLLNYPFRTHEFIAEVTSPTYIFHGNQDGLIDYSLSKNLYEASKPAHTEFITIPNGTHHNITASKTYQEKMAIILN